MKKTIAIKKHPGNYGCYILDSNTYVSDLLIDKINRKVKGVDRINRRGNYTLFINKASLFERYDVERDLLNLLREENYID